MQPKNPSMPTTKKGSKSYPERIYSSVICRNAINSCDVIKIIKLEIDVSSEF